MTLVRLEPAASRSLVKYSTAEPLLYNVDHYVLCLSLEKVYLAVAGVFL